MVQVLVVFGDKAALIDGCRQSTTVAELKGQARALGPLANRHSWAPVTPRLPSRIRLPDRWPEHRLRTPRRWSWRASCARTGCS